MLKIITQFENGENYEAEITGFEQEYYTVLKCFHDIQEKITKENKSLYDNNVRFKSFIYDPDNLHIALGLLWRNDL